MTSAFLCLLLFSLSLSTLLLTNSRTSGIYELVQLGKIRIRSLRKHDIPMAPFSIELSNI
jgi:hypothetical protein